LEKYSQNMLLKGFEKGPSQGLISLSRAFPLHEKVFSLHSSRWVGVRGADPVKKGAFLWSYKPSLCRAPDSILKRCLTRNVECESTCGTMEVRIQSYTTTQLVGVSPSCSGGHYSDESMGVRFRSASLQTYAYRTNTGSGPKNGGWSVCSTLLGRILFLANKDRQMYHSKSIEVLATSPVKRKSILGKYFLDNLKILLSFY
jgi:hypothetical protein